MYLHWPFQLGMEFFSLLEPTKLSDNMDTSLVTKSKSTRIIIRWMIGFSRMGMFLETYWPNHDKRWLEYLFLHWTRQIIEFCEGDLQHHILWPSWNENYAHYHLSFWIPSGNELWSILALITSSSMQHWLPWPCPSNSEIVKTWTWQNREDCHWTCNGYRWKHRYSEHDGWESFVPIAVMRMERIRRQRQVEQPMTAGTKRF